MRVLLVTALSVVGLTAGVPSGADARAAEQETASDRADWKRHCERRAERNQMRPKLRRPFIGQCIAGYRINAQRDLQSKKEKF